MSCFGALVLAGCSQPMSGDHANVMDVIEAKVALPPEAKPLTSYARYYARGKDGKVMATYVLPDVLKAEIDDCRGLDCQRAPLIAAGQRRWLAEWSILPIVYDRSCAMVFLTYNPDKKRVEELRCTEGLS